MLSLYYSILLCYVWTSSLMENSVWPKKQACFCISELQFIIWSYGLDSGIELIFYQKDKCFNHLKSISLAGQEMCPSTFTIVIYHNSKIFVVIMCKYMIRSSHIYIQVKVTEVEVFAVELELLPFRHLRHRMYSSLLTYQSPDISSLRGHASDNKLSNGNKKIKMWSQRVNIDQIVFKWWHKYYPI